MNVFLLLLALLIAAAVMWRRRRMVAVLLVLLACLPAWALLRQLPWWAYLIAAVLAVALGWHRLSRSASMVNRWSGRSRRKAGVASTWDIVRNASAQTMRRQAATVRPSLARLGRWARWRLPVAQVAIELCRAGWLTVWSPVEDVVMIFGGPRTGKTGWLAGRILDAPGAVLVTSTRTDLLQLCGPLRAKRGPVFVFNAVGLAGVASTITFDPLTGCSDPVTASERATDMLAAVSRGGSGGDREFWESQARRVLAALLHAAALGDRTMRDVLGWIAEPDKAGREVPTLLRRSGVQAFELDVTQFLSTNDRTRSSITSTVMPALGWLTHPAASAAAQPGHGFDVEQLLATRATVFLLGAEETQAGPLVCALTGHIAREARRLAANSPNGRLDPNLTLALDEAALISPVPLQSWTADMGGRGVTIIAAFQSRAQLLARWGVHDTATIINNCAALLIFGGTRDRDDLQVWSTLAGERDEPITTTDLNGRVASRSVRKVPVLAHAQIANLPAGKVLLIRKGIPPVIGRARMAWRRSDVRWHAYSVAHPGRAARLLGWAATARAWWGWATQPVRTAATATRRGLTAFRRWVGEQLRAALSATGAGLARGWRRVLRRPDPAVRVVPVDLDPPTVELVAAGARSEHGQGGEHDAGPSPQGPGPNGTGGAGRIGDGWWTP